ncbi:MAG TPA: pitrilysin family protein [Pyrinomonadaceae bacterium]|jgi:zinc protease|nr:pitrilysin family protein [Pyrinomonadaceae bacterium]
MKLLKLSVSSLSTGFLMLLAIGAFPLSKVRAQTPQATPPPPAVPRSVQFPKPVEKTLTNGLRVVVIDRPGTPLVTAQLVIKNGAEVDPPELAGIGNMLADLVTKGTARRDATQIAEEIEALGGSLYSSARWDSTRIGVDVMSPKIGPALDILADVARRPTFKAEEIDRLRQQTLDDLTVQLGEPGSIARYVAARITFGDAPYGQPLAGTTETITRIDREDFAKYHGRWYRPDNAILVLGGDIRALNAFALAQRYFGDWNKPATPLPVLPVPKPVANAAARVVVVDKADAGQAAVMVARAGIERTNPDYYRGLVANSVLSGYSGRLNQEIRIKRGLSYGASSQLDTRRGVGPFVASAQTKNQSAAQVAELLLGEVSRLATAAVPDVELSPRKAVVVGNFARTLETNAGLVSQIATLAVYGINFNELNRYIGSAQGVASSDVQSFAGSHLDAKTTSVVIVGNAKEFLPELRQKYPQVEVISMAELDLNSALLRKKQLTN